MDFKKIFFLLGVVITLISSSSLGDQKSLAVTIYND